MSQRSLVLGFGNPFFCRSAPPLRDLTPNSLTHLTNDVYDLLRGDLGIDSWNVEGRAQRPVWLDQEDLGPAASRERLPRAVRAQAAMQTFAGLRKMSTRSLFHLYGCDSCAGGGVHQALVKREHGASVLQRAGDHVCVIRVDVEVFRHFQRPHQPYIGKADGKEYSIYLHQLYS